MNLSRAHALAARGRSLYYAHQPVGGAPPRQWYRITNAAEPDTATVLVYGDIGASLGGVDAEQLVSDVQALDAKRIQLHINSLGGSMFDGFGIYAAFRNHPATVTAHVDGAAASAASIVAMGGNEVVMEKPARIMIHDAGVLTAGTPRDLREVADLLDEFSDSIAEIYADRAGGSVADFRAAMTAETWYSAAQAVEVGLADRVNGTTTAAPESQASQRIRARARVTLGGAK
ncbi:MAG TPA: head maturation protease, ClpP-related [Actinoplanes sp.]|nr:head maturation protease, ClpP-related [Actinoplanes sp.]